jgi:hypothetical protein
MRMLTSRAIATAAAAAIALTTFSLQPAAAGSRNDAAALAAFAAVFGTIAAVVAAEHYRDRPHYERSYNYGPVDRGPHPHGDWKHYRRW